MKYSGPYQIVFLLTNGNYKCTCTLSTTSGWVCRHFFRVMCMTSMVRFHINIINRHWFKDEVFGNELSNRDFIGLTNNDIADCTFQIPKKWVSIVSNEIIGLSKQDQEVGQKQLKTKQ